MPLYEYRCERCGDWEERQSFSDPPIEKCPECGNPCRRLPGLPAMVSYTYEGRIVNWANLKKDKLPYMEPKVYKDAKRFEEPHVKE